MPQNVAGSSGRSKTESERRDDEAAGGASDRAEAAAAQKGFDPRLSDKKVVLPEGAPKRESFPEGLGGQAAWNKAVRDYQHSHPDPMPGASASPTPSAGSQADDLEGKKKKKSPYGGFGDTGGA